jgi:hypothetical protein
MGDSRPNKHVLPWNELNFGESHPEKKSDHAMVN